jgi:hypothetical protein
LSYVGRVERGVSRRIEEFVALSAARRRSARMSLSRAYGGRVMLSETY